MDDNLDVKIAFEEIQMTYEGQEKTLKVIREMAATILGAASLVIALIGIFQIPRKVLPAFQTTYFGIIGIALLAYIVLILLCLVVLSTIIFFEPIKPEWEMLDKYYFGKNERDVFLQRISNYVNVIPLRDYTLKKRKKCVNWAGALFVIIILLLIASNLVP